MTSKDLKWPQMTTEQPQTTNQLEIKENNLKAGANIKINGHFLDEILHKK